MVEGDDLHLLVDAGDCEQTVDVGSAARESQPAADLPSMGGSGGDDMHAGAIHEGEITQVK